MASLVAQHSTTGMPMRKADFTAMVTGVSVMPAAILERVFPVQGATASKSTRPLGPMGSAWTMVWSTGRPAIPSTRRTQSWALPKRVSVV